ncbi:methyltransferase domain-containing protein [Aspergillus granulosus]|uniref:Methyltransferase domain-containing protein n=1 Tax=Aspergillus granulosus TaxID=176169 RepID=A0ABR4H712_9EURO
MSATRSLPLPDEWADPDAYVEALLSFATSSDLFRHLCGGIHMLDFLTREPDLYSTLLPEDWRAFFEQHEIGDIIDLMLREDIQPFFTAHKQGNTATFEWKGVAALPPLSLLDYIYNVRRLTLRRDFAPEAPGKPTIPQRIAVGMKVKKYHEVAHFSKYVNSLCNTVQKERGEDITHIVDFGSGQSYLGRTLASPPYNRHIVAIERKHQFINGANRMDVYAQLAEKKKVRMHNKKLDKCKTCEDAESPAAEISGSPAQPESDTSGLNLDKTQRTDEGEEEGVAEISIFRDISVTSDELGSFPVHNKATPKPVAVTNTSSTPRGAMDYIEHEITDGYLEPIIKDVVAAPPSTNAAETAGSGKKQEDPNVMVISLHSCGNLLHHGVRALVLNPSVKAIAMIGCCYNLMTERLGPATYKIPVLRTMHPRLSKDATAYDPHGFPMSKRLEEYEHNSGSGVKMNITARSMAVQAPYNWDRDGAEDFFTRHYYRTLLQRVLVDRGVVPKPNIPKDLYSSDPNEMEDAGNPLIVGSLRKAAFTSFQAYIRAAIVKLSRDPVYGQKVKDGMADITDEELDRYAEDYWPTKKRLSVTWTLMSFSAAVAEAIIVVDRWQYLREQDCVKECWVEPVFDYGLSPRNLAVIGIKK